MKKELYLAAMAMLALTAAAEANNLAVHNSTIVPRSGGRVEVRFDLSWENSWRDAINHDAAWLFVKYSTDSGASWHHATLKASGVNPGGFERGSNPDVEIVVPADLKGAFVQRASNGTGTFATASMALVWDLNADGVSPTNMARVKVCGVEMVYVPEGAFYVGDDWSTKPFWVSHITTNDINATGGSGAGTIAEPYTNAAGLGRPRSISGTFTNTYPNGYDAFYCMKYELSRGQYLDFLNMIPAAASASIFREPFGRYNTIDGAYPNYTNSAPFLPWSFWYDDGEAGWGRTSAYLDWAALRPMTELEFEKAARGTVKPIDGEYPWGAAGNRILLGTENFIDEGTENERPSHPDINTLVNAIGVPAPSGPLRCGAFADAGTDQFQAGASYYGIMDMGGSLLEWTIDSGPVNSRNGVCSPVAQAFGGSHGDGAVDAATGLCNVPDWPTEASNADGAGLRGGSCSMVPHHSAVADRTYAAHDYPYQSTVGCRGVRSAP